MNSDNSDNYAKIFIDYCNYIKVPGNNPDPDYEILKSYVNMYKSYIIEQFRIDNNFFNYIIKKYF